MKALLLAAGLGTRLRPYTDKKPKCLMEVRGRPLLDIWLQNLEESGIEETLINTGYLAEQVNEYLNNSKYSKTTKVVHEDELLGTAGTLQKNIDFFLEQDMMLVHADNYCEENLSNLIAAHLTRPEKCLLTMLVFQTDQPSECGIVTIDENKIVTSFHEKKDDPPGSLANGAVYILSSEFLKIIKKKYKNKKDFSIEILPNFMDKIFTFETKMLFVDIGTPQRYQKVNQLDISKNLD